VWDESIKSNKAPGYKHIGGDIGELNGLKNHWSTPKIKVWSFDLSSAS
jgi:hypothetical protein